MSSQTICCHYFSRYLLFKYFPCFFGDTNVTYINGGSLNCGYPHLIQVMKDHGSIDTYSLGNIPMTIPMT